MLTKLKYVGVKKEDLLNIYFLYIRSLLEYSLAFNTLKSSLDQSIWGYEEAFSWSGLDYLSKRREQTCLAFGLKILLHPVHHNMFPVNPETSLLATRKREHFTVNWAKSESYRQSTIPYIQRKLNEYVQSQQRSK